MNPIRLPFILAGSLSFLPVCGFAATRHVDLNSASPTPPYTNWATAARTIQDAVDAALDGDEILVTNGVYESGGRVSGSLTNRVAITKPVTVRSVNGPEVTVIQGYRVPGVTFGYSAVRCVFLGDGAALVGFTLTNGATASDGASSGSGGGVWCSSMSALVSNCVLIGNAAYLYGGGAYQGTLNRCTIHGNSVIYQGGGVYGSTLNNCTLTANQAAFGGGAYLGRLKNCALTGNSARAEGGGANKGMLANCTLTGNRAGTGGGTSGGSLNNCIVYYNTARLSGDNHSAAGFNYSCTTPLPPGGTGNISGEPHLASASHLSADSPCREAGSAAYASGLDIDGEPWANPPSIGCDELSFGAVTGALSVGIVAGFTNVASDFELNFMAQISGQLHSSRWEFGDGTVLSNRPFASHRWLAPGSYRVVLSAYNENHSDGVSATVTVHVVEQPVHYVALNNATPLAPHDSWATAATNIQAAVDAAAVGALVLVSNGVYQTGGQLVEKATNRLAVTKPLTVRSVNGPGATSIAGFKAENASAVRCAYLTNGAALMGFTLTNGAAYGDGGGVWCASASAVVSNCVLTGNSAFESGGGASGGTLMDCTLTGNSSTYGSGGGAAGATLNRCTLTGNSTRYGDDGDGRGGGAFACTLDNCMILSNSASYFGGGAAASTLSRCTLTGNLADRSGGGASGGTLMECTITGNSAYRGGGAHSARLTNCTLAGNLSSVFGGGADGATLNNCILTGNSSTHGGGATYGSLSSCVVSHNSATFSGGGVSYASLVHCTVTGNTARDYGGGGVVGATLQNCIVYDNSAANGVGPNHLECTLNYSCTTPLPASGAGNITDEPQLSSASHLSAGSPCRAAGSAAYARGVDLDGQVWASPPSMGCDELHSGGSTGLLSVAIAASQTNVAMGFEVKFTALISGQAFASRWEFGDGTGISNRPDVSHSWAAAGDYPVVLWAYNDSHPLGVSSTGMVHVIEPAVLHVAQDSNSPLAPYSTWSTAATNIQDAIDAATMPGSLVLVTNGVYESGGRLVAGVLRTNRVAVTRALTVRSVNGPGATMISGGGVVRCAYLTNGARLVGFTLTNGFAEEGGGVWCETAGASVSGCLLTGNLALRAGGGAFSGTLNNCIVACNSVQGAGGGAYGSILNNCTIRGNASAGDGGGAHTASMSHCTVTGNSAGDAGGGAYSSILNNSVVYDNTVIRGSGPNYSDSTLNYSCTTPLPLAGIGNLAAEPQLASASHLSAGSPCRGAGNATYSRGLDVDGESWGNPPSMGCDEYRLGGATGPLTLGIEASSTNVATGFQLDFRAQINGRTSGSQWEFGDGTVVSNQPYVRKSWTSPGDHAVVLRAYNESVPAGLSATVIVHVTHQPLHYVALHSGNPVAPYSSWATAANSIQEAVNAAAVGGTVLVSNGVYQTGGRSPFGMSNRVAVTKPVTVRSVNGPEVTAIAGHQVPGTRTGPTAVRCVYLGEGAVLMGFTLTNGATPISTYSPLARSGGGVWCASPDILVSNCVLTGNAADLGAGASLGTLIHCTLTGNFAQSGGGAASRSALSHCTLSGNSADYLGGAAYLGTLNHCTISGNLAFAFGGGVYGSTLNSCLLTGNYQWDGGCENCAQHGGGGAANSTLNSCTLTGNYAYSGGGAYQCSLNNCILYFHTWSNYADSTLNHCCTTPLPAAGQGNFTNAPLFVDLPGGNLRLQPNSPCINAGRNINAATGTDLDLDGLPRLVGGTVDVGAYEFQSPGSVLSHAWLQQFGLPLDGSADFVDSDGDGRSNWQEWRCDTRPNDALSVLRLLAPAHGASGLTLRWESVNTRTYYLQRSTHPADSGFATIQSNIVGQTGMTIHTVPSATQGGPSFYRVGVQ